MNYHMIFVFFAKTLDFLRGTNLLFIPEAQLSEKCFYLEDFSGSAEKVLDFPGTEVYS